MGMSFSNVRSRILNGIQNLDMDRFRLLNLGGQTGIVIVCVDNKLYSYTFNTFIRDINVAIYKCNVAFNENRWPDKIFMAYYTHDKKFAEKRVCNNYQESNDHLAKLNAGANWSNRFFDVEITEQEYLTL